MDKITFAVTLHKETNEGGILRYEPGSTISGLVQLIPNEDVNARGVTVRLQWRTEGRGDLNSATIGQTDIWQGNLVKGRPVPGEFSFQLPPQPWSYSGHYISIVWEILVFVDVPLAVDPNFGQGFVMRPGREE